MNPTTDTRHRRSIRMPGWGYAETGAYFVTIVAQGRTCWFDHAVCRDIVDHEWRGLPARFPTVQLDAFVVMPNHVHFVIWLDPVEGAASALVAQSPPRAQWNCAPTTKPAIGQSLKADPNRPALGQVVRAFKAVSAHRIRQGTAEEFAWQRNYYERVIRNERELNAIRQYIQNNPAHWAEDRENPNHPR